MGCLTEISQYRQNNTDAVRCFCIVIMLCSHDELVYITPNNTISVDFVGKITPAASDSAQPYEVIALTIVSEPLILLSGNIITDSQYV